MPKIFPSDIIAGTTGVRQRARARTLPQETAPDIAVTAPRYDYSGVMSAIAREGQVTQQAIAAGSEAVTRTAQLFSIVEAQRDERVAQERIQQWQVADADVRSRLFQADPKLDYEAPNRRDVETIYQKQSQRLQADVTKGLSKGAATIVTSHIAAKLPERVISVRAEALKSAALEEARGPVRYGYKHCARRKHCGYAARARRPHKQLSNEPRTH